MAKLVCINTQTNETQEITEKVFLIDGYCVADRVLEGVLFEVKFDDSGITEVKVEDKSKNYFEDLNTKKFLGMVKSYAQEILETGDEVMIPYELEKKYFKNKNYYAGIVVENEHEVNPVVFKKTTFPDEFNNLRNFFS